MDPFMITVIILIFITLILAMFRVNCPPEAMTTYNDIFCNSHSTPGNGDAYPVKIYRLPYNYPAGVWTDSPTQHFDRPANWYL